MTCHDIDGLISSHEAAEHVAGCERCRRPMRLLDQGPDVPAPSEGQLKQIQAAMADNLKPVRPLAPSGVFLLALAVVSLPELRRLPLFWSPSCFRWPPCFGRNGNPLLFRMA